MIGSGIDWTNVLVALIASLPAIIAAIASLMIHSKIKTPSGTSIGKQVEGVQHTTLGNAYRLQRMTGDIPPPQQPQPPKS